MQTQSYFPDLGDIEPTRETLHLYAAAMGVVSRAHAVPHPKWWHISLKVRPDGLVTNSMALPGGGSFALRMDLINHEVILHTSQGNQSALSMREGLTGSEFGSRLLDGVKALGLEGEYVRQKFEDDSPREYNPKAATRLFSAFVNVDQLFKKHRATLSGEVSPVQIWPHGFDIAFEWLGARIVEHEEDGQATSSPSQLNLGFYPGRPEPYFYSNPWPFEKDQLVDQSLPESARWHLEGWEGAFLPYAALAGKDDAGQRLLDFARRVYEISSPTLR